MDSEEFFGELCNDLKASAARGRPVSIECKADSVPISMDQATSLGLIVNELVTNAIKHAFPNGRAGRIRVAFEALKNELKLCVEDDGVGFRPRMQKDAGLGTRTCIRAGGSTRGSFGSRIDDRRQLIPPVRSVRNSGPLHPIRAACATEYPLRCRVFVLSMGMNASSWHDLPFSRSSQVPEIGMHKSGGPGRAAQSSGRDNMLHRLAEQVSGEPLLGCRVATVGSSDRYRRGDRGSCTS